MITLHTRLFLTCAILLPVAIESANAQGDLRPILNTLAKRLVEKCQDFGCACDLDAERAEGRLTGNQVYIDGELRASADFIDARARVKAKYYKSECKLVIIDSDIRGDLKGTSLCRGLAELAGGVDFLRKELETGKEVNLDSEDCDIVNRALSNMFDTK